MEYVCAVFSHWSCVPLCNPMDSSLPGFPVRGDSPDQNNRGGCHALLQGIFPSQGSSPGLPPCRWILYQLSHQGRPRTLEWVACPFPRESFQPSNQTGVSCIPKTLKRVSCPFPKGIFWTQESNRGLMHCKADIFPAELPRRTLNRSSI